MMAIKRASASNRVSPSTSPRARSKSRRRQNPVPAPRAVPLDLTRTEFDIVALLSKKAGRVYDRAFIYEQVWGWSAEGDSSIVREHIRRIRKKFAEAGSSVDPIETVWGVGYRWGVR